MKAVLFLFAWVASLASAFAFQPPRGSRRTAGRLDPRPVQQRNRLPVQRLSPGVALKAATEDPASVLAAMDQVSSFLTMMSAEPQSDWETFVQGVLVIMIPSTFVQLIAILLLLKWQEAKIAAKNLDRRFDKTESILDKQKNRIKSTFDKQDPKLDTEISKQSDKISKVDNTTSKTETNLNDKIFKLDTKTKARFTETNRKIDDLVRITDDMDNQHAALKSRVEKLERATEEHPERDHGKKRDE